jgi:hypothetical protein
MRALRSNVSKHLLALRADVALALFCNVFRVARPLELLWADVFVVLAGATILWGVPGWWSTTLGSVCVAALAIAVEMRKPSYHGVGWQRINPDLRAWWNAHEAQKASC